MSRYLLRRGFGAVTVVFFVFTISFFIMRLSPGSPFDEEKALPPAVVANQAEVTGMAAPVTSPVDGKLARFTVENNDEVTAGQTYAVAVVGGKEVELKAEEDFTVFRLTRRKGEKLVKGQHVLFRDTGLWTQYLTTLWSYARLDFGVTFDSKGQRTVGENISETLPVSAELGVYALLIALLLGVTGGLVAGLRQNTWADHTIMSFAMIGISIPGIVLGPLLILIFVMELEWLPATGGWEGWEQKLLPSIALGLAYAAYFARLSRGGMLDVIKKDFIRTARAKGVSERNVVTRHALKGAILPAVTYLGPALAHLLVGSIVIEEIFGIPGISKYFVQSAINRDYPMVMGVVVLYSVLLVTFNLLVDIAYAFLDPRVRYD